MKACRRTHSTSSPPSSPSPPPPPPPASSSSWVHLRSVFLVVVAPSSSSSSPASSSSSSSSAHVASRGSLKSPWSRKRRKHALSPRLWKSLFATDGKIKDEVKLLKKVRSGGVDPRIREEVWPFLLGIYELNSTESERSDTRTQKRKEYENLRRQCRRMSRKGNRSGKKSRESSRSQSIDSPSSEDVVSARESLSTEDIFEEDEDMERNDDMKQHEEEKVTDSKFDTGKIVEEEEDDKSEVTADIYTVESDSSESESSEDESGSPSDTVQENGKYSNLDSLKNEDFKTDSSEDFGTWQRIIRLDASLGNSDWVQFSSSQSSVSVGRARRAANAVGRQEYEHMEPCRIYHAARLVAILEAYAIYDPEIGYCQGMCDLLSPIVAVVDEDHEAFWCSVGFMKKARHNFRLDEVGIKRQLNFVSKIIKNKDSHLYKHLEKLQAEDCFFVYRMVMVLFRRELTFEQTLCLWEVIWADQAAIRAGIGKSAWGRIRQHAPPTEDLLLYAIAACVLRRRKLIIEKYSSMDEILRECNDMSGQLDVWKLLDDAHDLVVTLHDKI